jgi:hypothetical protein
MKSAFPNLLAAAICFSLGLALMRTEWRSSDSWSDHAGDHAGGGGH